MSLIARPSGFMAQADPYFSSVVLLAHLNGANGGTTFTDIKGHALTANGNVQTSTAQSKFAGSSGLFDGTTDWVSMADASNLRMGSSAYTLELFVRYTTLPTSGNVEIFLQKGRAGNSDLEFNCFLFNNSGTTIIRCNSSVDGVVQTVNSSSTITPSTGIWYHVAVCKTGTAMSFWFNGAAAGTSTDIATYFGGTSTLCIGATPVTGASGHNGNMAEVRITKGAVRVLH